MTPRRQRLLAVGLAAAGIAIAVTFTLKAFEENMMFYVEISDVHSGNAPKNRSFRVGGIVLENSIQRLPGDLAVQFTLTDNVAELPVTYSGVLPDLFREGQGSVAHGQLNDSGVFVADTVLAKHDENYMAPEVADSLAKAAAAKAAAEAESGT
jgi:cytochrome c-type biogenesis protein CcmE